MEGRIGDLLSVRLLFQSPEHKLDIFGSCETYQFKIASCAPAIYQTKEVVPWVDFYTRLAGHLFLLESAAVGRNRRKGSRYLKSPHPAHLL